MREDPDRDPRRRAQLARGPRRQPEHPTSRARRGVHVVTVNDYLARRDAEWMSPSTRRSVSASACCRACSPRREAARLRLRRHLRHQLGVRLRLPARQHGQGPRREGPARPPLRGRGRGRQHPHRRGPHAADHLRRPRTGRRPVRQVRELAPRMVAGKTPEGMDPRSKKQFMADFDFEMDEKHKTVSITEQGVAKAEKFLGIDHLYRAENGHLVNHLIQSLRAAGAVQARRRLRGHRRRGRDHRRVHRPHPRGQALVGGPAPGDRGQGGRARSRRRTRPWRRSPTRTTSASTTSSRA